MIGYVLLVEDDAANRDVQEQILAAEGFRSRSAGNGEEALRRIADEAPAAVVLDLGLPDMDGRDVLKRCAGAVPVVVVTGQGELDVAVECMRLGATDFIQKPYDRARLVASVRNACTNAQLTRRVEALASELRRFDGFSAFVGSSPAIGRALGLLRRAAASDVTVLLEGESGTGKELAARALHAEGSRRAGPFVAVNCGAIPEGLVESELFGHEKGAFTGAHRKRIGSFEQASGGTIFLDEVAELRLDLQVKLLRVLQERVVQRLGNEESFPVDVRVIAASNRKLEDEVSRGRLRSDLFYRLAVFPVELPALRDRPDDIVLLAQHFLARHVARHGRALDGMTDDARKAIRLYSWPGNVRELENALERAVLLEDGSSLGLGSLPEAVVCALDQATSGRPTPRPGVGSIVPFADEERRIILEALERTSWDVQEAARRLEIGRATIYRKIERYNLRPERFSR